MFRATDIAGSTEIEKGEWMERDMKKRKPRGTLKVRTAIKGGRISLNHNRRVV